eukprot:8087947-Pyramimonas_sp.AAC.1
MRGAYTGSINPCKHAYIRETRTMDVLTHVHTLPKKEVSVALKTSSTAPHLAEEGGLGGAEDELHVPNGSDALHQLLADAVLQDLPRVYLDHAHEGALHRQDALREGRDR